MHHIGDNLTILNCEYERPHRLEDGTLTKDYITMVYKNLANNTKEHKIIYSPKYTYYMLKEGKEKSYSQFFVPKEDTVEITVPYRNLLRDIAKRTNHLEEFYDNCKSGNSKGNKVLNTDPRVLASDIPIESYYRMEFNKLYQNNVCKVDKCYLDIEVDNKLIDGRFPLPGECPINVVSVLMENTMTEYTFILKDKNNPNSYEFEQYTQTNDFIQEYKDFLNKNLNGWKNVHRMRLDKINYQLFFMEDELNLIKAVFFTINHYKPDFVLAWNMAFDIPYIIERIKYLGGNPVDIMCSPDFEEKQAFYFVDKAHNIAEERGDYARISSYSVYLDQMIQFASRRKGQSAYANNKLDYIGEMIAGCHKLDYHNIVENLADLPYVDFKTFIMYNMNDVMVQWCIEEKTGDIDYVFNKSILNSTSYSKVHRQTVYLANRFAMFLWNKGFIIGNNVNKYNNISSEEKDKRKFPGAYVANPVLLGNTPKVKLHYNGLSPMPIMVAKNANDFDYKALYPSLIRENNIAPNTMIGMTHIPDKVYDKENPFHKEEGIYKDQFNRSETFIENLASQNYIEFCHRWLKLASYEEMIDDVMEYFSTVEHPSIPIDRGDLITIAVRMFKNEKIKVAERLEKDEKIKVALRKRSYPDSTKMRNKLLDSFK